MKKERIFSILAIIFGIIVAVVLYRAAENKQLKNDEMQNYAFSSSCFVISLSLFYVPPKIKKYADSFFIPLLVISSCIYLIRDLVTDKPTDYFFYSGIAAYAAGFVISLVTSRMLLKKAQKRIRSV
jgi:hypothetical protein